MKSLNYIREENCLDIQYYRYIFAKVLAIISLLKIKLNCII